MSQWMWPALAVGAIALVFAFAWRSRRCGAFLDVAYCQKRHDHKGAHRRISDYGERGSLDVRWTYIDGLLKVNKRWC